MGGNEMKITVKMSKEKVGVKRKSTIQNGKQKGEMVAVSIKL